MRFITKKKLDRRTFLQGTATSIALPLLDSMLPAFATSDIEKRTRLICIEEVHGLPGCTKWGSDQNLFAPATTGRNYKLVSDNTLKILEPWRDSMTIVSNTDVRMAEAQHPSEVGADHFRSSATFLTQAHPKQTQASDIYCGTSLDQLHAHKYGQSTTLPSLQMGIEPADKGGGCGYNYSCAYTDSISWSSPNEPLPMIRNPRTAFDMLFGSGGTEKERHIRRKMHASILDWVVDDIASIKSEVGAVDIYRIDKYLEHVREIERRIQLVETRNQQGENRELPDAPPGVPDSFSEHAKLMYDLQVLACEADITRVISFKLGRDASNRILPESGSSKGFHPSSHHGDSIEAIKEFNAICQYRMKQTAYFVDRLENIMDGDTTLLDQSMIIWGSPMGDANVHNHRRCPLVVLGGANGVHQGGTHIKAADDTPMANAMLRLLNLLGHERESFGDSTGEISI
ncbi:MAG: hypothetical protein CMO98_03240 [Woeseia sp.]|nr:hypothetical protein [Woeseia sp.]|tara:strand:+ start:6302 stop:7672 length:1371 start_codon:yes stop_codon:yes gene_type:complete